MHAQTTIVASLLALAPAALAADFGCIKPVNPIPAGPPGACCEELNQSHLLKFLYTGKNCVRATKVSEAKDGSTTYSACSGSAKAACCDPLLTALDHATNPACVLPSN